MTKTPPDPADPRHLRLVPPPTVATSVVQLADHPGAYAVRRGGPAEAIMHRGNAGDWYLMYNHNPDAGDGAEAWLGSATLSGQLDEQAVAAAAIELIEASRLIEVAPLWPLLLGRMIDVGGAPVEVARLHAPDDLGFCTGDNVADDDRVRWHQCATVMILAATVGVELPA